MIIYTNLTDVSIRRLIRRVKTEFSTWHRVRYYQNNDKSEYLALVAKDIGDNELP